ncbi:hypothetical protein ACLMJK_002834 [Lecanora helva]
MSFILLLLYLSILYHTPNGLNLLVGPSVLPAVPMDPCVNRSPSSQPFPPSPLLIRVHADNTYLNLTNHAIPLDPSDKGEFLDALTTIRRSVREDWSEAQLVRSLKTFNYQSARLFFISNPEGQGRRLTEITTREATNIVTTICGLVNAYGPEKMGAEVLDSDGRYLGDLLRLSARTSDI